MVDPYLPQRCTRGYSEISTIYNNNNNSSSSTTEQNNRQCTTVILDIFIHLFIYLPLPLLFILFQLVFQVHKIVSVSFSFFLKVNFFNQPADTFFQVQVYLFICGLVLVNSNNLAYKQGCVQKVGGGGLQITQRFTHSSNK